jgi:hypothetical protein
MLPDSTLRTVERVLDLRGATCLQRCLVLQAWLLARGELHDIVIGVPRPGEAFQAHAWLADWTPDPKSEGFAELTRLPAKI